MTTMRHFARVWVLNFSYIYMGDFSRSEEHTSELQSRFDLVCRLPLEKKLTNGQPQQQVDLNSFNTAATAETCQLFNSVVSGSKVVQAHEQGKEAIGLTSSGSTHGEHD